MIKKSSFFTLLAVFFLTFRCYARDAAVDNNKTFADSSEYAGAYMWKKEIPKYNPGGTMFENDLELSSKYYANKLKFEKEREWQLKQRNKLKSERGMHPLPSEDNRYRQSINTDSSKKPQSSSQKKKSMVTYSGIDLASIKGAKFIDQTKSKTQKRE